MILFDDDVIMFDCSLFSLFPLILVLMILFEGDDVMLFECFFFFTSLVLVLMILFDDDVIRFDCSLFMETTPHDLFAQVSAKRWDVRRSSARCKCH